MRPGAPTIILVAAAVTAAACGERAAGGAGPAVGSAGPAAGSAGAAGHGDRRAAIDDAQLTKLLREADAHGAVLVTEVATGAVVASAGVGRDVAAPVLPLSVIKLCLAALWWEHDRGDGDFAYRGRRVTVHDVLVDGWDHPGEEMAIELRRTLGAQAMLAELRGYGLGAGLTLPGDADDARWGSALSIGEHDAVVTLPIVAGFLRAIGGGTSLLRPETRQRLQSAMRGAVEQGTAKSAGARLGAMSSIDERSESGGEGPCRLRRRGGGPPPFDRLAPRRQDRHRAVRRGAARRLVRRADLRSRRAAIYGRRVRRAPRTGRRRGRGNRRRDRPASRREAMTSRMAMVGLRGQ